MCWRCELGGVVVVMELKGVRRIFYVSSPRSVRHFWLRSHAEFTPPPLPAQCNSTPASYRLGKSSRTMLWLLARSSRYS
jgi:hypothetical protein